MLKKMLDVAVRTLPIVFVIIVTIVASEMLYQNMTNTETDNTWSELKGAIQDVSKELTLRISDNMMILDLAADGIALNEYKRAEMKEYIAAVRAKTFFKRIDVIFPDGSVLMSENSSYDTRQVRALFSEVERRGAFLSQRMTDEFSGKEVLCYYTPVVYDGETQGVLVGAVECESLDNMIISHHYEGEAQVVLMDTRDGKFIIDNWHDGLTDLFSVDEMQMHEDYKDIDFVNSVLNGEEGKFAFVSNMDEKVYHISYKPVEQTPFSVAIFVQEDILFVNLYEMENTLYIVRVIEFLVLLVVLIYNVIVVSRLESNREKLMVAEVEKNKTEAKSRFLSSISHDLRTPLNGIIGMLEVIRLRGDIPDHMTASLHKIDVSAKYLMSLAGDVLDYNAVDTGKVVFTKDNINLKDMLDDIAIVMESRAAEKNVAYETDFSRLNEPAVIASEVHVNKVLGNIIGNAIKYNVENGKVSVVVSDKAIDAKTNAYTFVVRDTGVGISEEFQKTMFDAFEQENAGARTGRSGHGLGLSIAEKLVTAMNGTIKVHSKKNEGTAFEITIPFEVDREFEYQSDEGFSEQSIVGTKILVAEDNELNMEIAEAMLSSFNIEIAKAGNGKEALRLFENSEPFYFDAILMDIMMPEMDGLQATAAIRQLKREDSKYVPIIAMTANTFSEDIKRCKDAGMNEHIAKPLDLDIMASKIAKNIEIYRKKQEKKNKNN